LFIFLNKQNVDEQCGEPVSSDLEAGD